MASLKDHSNIRASTSRNTLPDSKDTIIASNKSSLISFKNSSRKKSSSNSLQRRTQYSNLLRIKRSRLSSCSSDMIKSGQDSPYHTEKIEKGTELVNIAKNSHDSTLFKQASVKYKYEHSKQMKKKFKLETIKKFISNNPYKEYLLTLKALRENPKAIEHSLN